jgi:hypothetical protein
MATSAMRKAGATNGATGENAVIVGARRADIIVGPVGIAIADSLLGEITPAMATAIGQSEAIKILLTVNKCNNLTQNKLEKCKKTKIIIWLAYFVAFFKKIQ